MLLLIRPKHFGFNAQTAGSNVFQQALADDAAIQERALREFDALIELLHLHDIEHIVFDDTDEPLKHDAVFPNNWFSTDYNGQLILYPMLAPNRRTERRKDIITYLNQTGYLHTTDLTTYENKNMFLEGTGSLILDRTLRYAYMCRSQRSHEALLDEFCTRLGYEKMVFDARTPRGEEIYHTNVMMSIGHEVCIIGDTLIPDESERIHLLEHLDLYYHLVQVDEDQIRQFAANTLFVTNQHGQGYWLMSTTAMKSYSPQQIKVLENDGTILATQIDTIEKYGGGSLRCMLAELV
ncbi:MAG: citrulline utilization hydrolase CtlX [Bacteroidota bacterium]